MFRMTNPRFVFEVHNGAKIDFARDVDKDLVSYFEMVHMIKDLGYSEKCNIYHKLPDCDLDGGLRDIKTNGDVVVMFAICNDKETISIYVVNPVVEEGQGADLVNLEDDIIDCDDNESETEGDDDTVSPRIVLVIVILSTLQMEMSWRVVTLALSWSVKHFCKKWDVTGIPCPHGIAAIVKDKRQPEAFVHEFFHKESYMRSYAEIINRIPDQTQWLHTEYDAIMAPPLRRPSGRSKKLRRRAVDEPKNPNAVKRTHQSLSTSIYQNQFISNCNVFRASQGQTFHYIYFEIAIQEDFKTGPSHCLNFKGLGDRSGLVHVDILNKNALFLGIHREFGTKTGSFHAMAHNRTGAWNLCETLGSIQSNCDHFAQLKQEVTEEETENSYCTLVQIVAMGLNKETQVKTRSFLRYSRAQKAWLNLLQSSKSQMRI
ncbi:hypothetical protein RHGRI_029657 [Rhododendron griersonianum]|uniref:Zinc finger PMZ-type domain-containing protein n=1 Tax=Rhododendron griersonianum TaxID=479676 RepID=A0AAV6IK96_9ERIC|nr:hypothetical protein RHGRI_029657 [Rhododendron griersonianum]